MEAESRLQHLLQRLDQDCGSGACTTSTRLRRRIGNAGLVDHRRHRGEPLDPPWPALGEVPRWQQRIVAATTPLRQDVARRVGHLTESLNHCVSFAGRDVLCETLPQQLLSNFRAIDSAPQLLYFRLCCDLDAKTRFLVALAGAIRAVQDPALLRPQMAAQPHVLILAESIAGAFFTIGGDNVLRRWHDARLDGYCALWQVAAESALKLHKQEPPGSPC
ncbi:unnamed protein product [Effrenium voratum]|nr:unnamed protein product [Effrenium voratum]